METTRKPNFYYHSVKQLTELNKMLNGQTGETTNFLTAVKMIENRLDFVKSEIKSLMAAKEKEQAAEQRWVRDELDAALKTAKAEVQGSKYLSSLTVEQIVKLRDFIDYTDGIDHEYKGDTLGTAVKSGSFDEDSAEWHEARANGVGGSDIAIIMGVSPFKKRDALLKMKTGEIVQKANNSGGAALRGHIWEGFIAREFADRNPDKKVLFSKDSWNKDGSPFHKANFDGLICENGSSVPNAILEIKTSSKPEDWENGVPYYYRLQILWYMDACGFSKGYFAVRINDSEYREYAVTPEEGEMEAIHAEVDKFNTEVKARKAELAA